MTLSAQALYDSSEALQSRDVKTALAVRDREYRKDGNVFDDSIIRTIEFILSSTPELLTDCPLEVLEPLRIAAAMMELWGLNTLKPFVTIDGEWDYRFGAEAVVRMLLSHGCFLRTLESYRKTGFTTVELLDSRDPDACEACRSANGQKFPINDVPELPLVTCRCQTRYGCGLIIIVRKEDNRH